MRKIGLYFASLLGVALSMSPMTFRDGNTSALNKSQQKERVIVEAPLFDLPDIIPSPISIDTLTGESAVFQRNRTTDARQRDISTYSTLTGENWLEGLNVTITNKSDKIITYASIDLCVPRGESYYDVSLCVPAATFGHNYTRTKTSPTILIHPGETASASFPNVFLDALKKGAEAEGIFSLERLVMRIDRVIFEDLTMWSKGSLLRQHPNDHKTWVRIGKEDLYEKELEMRKKKPNQNEENNKIGYQQSSSNASLNEK